MTPDRERPVRRRTLTRDKVIEAAFTIVDEDGWDQLTMSALANRVGVVGTSLRSRLRSPSGGSCCCPPTVGRKLHPTPGSLLGHLAHRMSVP